MRGNRKRATAVLVAVAFSIVWILALFFVEVKGQEEQTTVFSTEEVPKELTSLYAKAAVLMDADNGRVLFEKNGYEQMPMASTTKIMTCILALEYGRMEDIVTVSSYAASQPKVHLGMRNGQCFALKDLLYSLMLESHNDSAVAIAEHIGGSVQGFADMMNQKARDLGCSNTYFITPNGLDAEKTAETAEGSILKVHSTTASDLARIMAYCITSSEKSGEFLEITRTVSYSFHDAEGKSHYSCNNHNAFLTMMEGALTGKTGFTAKAGYCYVGALKRDGKTFVVALLACGWPNNKSYKWSDTKKLMNYGLAHYSYQDFSVLQKQARAPESIAVKDGQTAEIQEEASVRLTFAGSITGGMLLHEEESIEIRYVMKEKLAAPVKKGDEAGEMQYLVNGELCYSKAIVASENMEKIDLKWCFRMILQEFFM